jgi:predicted transcriptional regulator
MKPPCVIVVKYILPAIRMLVAKELIEKYDMCGIDASAIMELTPAAITQYLKGKRGAMFIHEILRSEEAMKKVSKLAETLARKNVSMEDVMKRLCEICVMIRSEELVCKLHQKELPALKGCAMCKCVRTNKAYLKHEVRG